MWQEKINKRNDTTHPNDKRHLNTHQSATEMHTDTRIHEINVIGDDDGHFPKEYTKDSVANKTILHNTEVLSAIWQMRDTVFDISGFEGHIFYDTENS